MGSDTAPSMAYVFLCCYQNRWVHNVKKIYLNRVRCVVNDCRFIDNVTAINNGGEFKRSYLYLKNISEIYIVKIHPELELEEGKHSL